MTPPLPAGTVVVATIGVAAVLGAWAERFAAPETFALAMAARVTAARSAPAP